MRLVVVVIVSGLLASFASAVESAGSWRAAMCGNLGSTRPIRCEFTGFAQPWRQLTLVAEFGGRVLSVAADVGDVLTEAPVVRLDASQLAWEAQQLQAEDAALSADDALIAAQITQAERRLNHQEQEVTRVTNLSEQGRVSQTRYDELVFARDDATLSVAALRVQRELVAARRASVAARQGDLA